MNRGSLHGGYSAKFNNRAFAKLEVPHGRMAKMKITKIGSAPNVIVDVHGLLG